MRLLRIPPEQQRVVPWKNGGGVTREVALDPAGQGFRWRVSLATLGRDGPFSAFPGVDRVLWLVRGTGLSLTLEGREVRPERLEPVSFAGEARVEARLLAGPTEDLNLMTDRALVRAAPRLLRLRAQEAWGGEVALAGQDLLLALEGEARVRPPEGGFQRLGPGEALRLDDGPPGRRWALVAGREPLAALLVSFSPV